MLTEQIGRRGYEENKPGAQRPLFREGEVTVQKAAAKPSMALVRHLGYLLINFRGWGWLKTE